MTFFLNKIKHLVLGLLCLNLIACENVGLWAINSLARFSEQRLIADISYGEHVLNKLDLYQPLIKNEQDKPLATLVFIYGGCWGGCQTISKEKYRFVAESLTKLGYLVVIPDYRHYPEVGFPEIIADVSKTVEWVNQSIADYGGDGDNIFLMGHSAGGHLSAMLTLNERYLSAKSYQGVRGFIGLAGAYDFKFDEAYQFEIFKSFKQHADSQPIHFVDGDEPPLLLLHGRNDTTVKLHNIVNLTAKVKAKKGEVKAIYYDNIDHIEIISALSIPLQNQTTIHQDIVEFLALHRKK